MASTIRIIGVSVLNQGFAWVVDNVRWWPIEDFIGIAGKGTMDPRFRESVDSTLYLDYIGIFNSEEFIKLNDGYKASFFAKIGDSSSYDNERKRIKDVDDKLKPKPHRDTKWFLVEQYEWETGMS
jgi:hypothetical protein